MDRTGENVISIAVPVQGENNEFKGVALGMFRLDANAVSSLYGTLIKLRIGRTGSAYLVDGKGAGDLRFRFRPDWPGVYRSPGASEEALGGQVGRFTHALAQGQGHRRRATRLFPAPTGLWWWRKNGQS